LQAKEKKVKLIFKYRNFVKKLKGYRIRIDASKFAQVIRNLVSNAIKFTDAEGTVTITIEPMERMNSNYHHSYRLSTVNDHDSFDAIAIHVVDFGAGISEASKWNEKLVN